MDTAKIYLTFFCALLFCNSCNLYSSLTKANTDPELIEEANRCLRDNDYACAIEKYGQLSDPILKSKKLCLVHMSKAGLSLSALVTTLTQAKSTVMGELANQMIPWTTERMESSTEAKTHCTALEANAESGNEGVLLNSISRFLDCAIRMAKVDLFVATSNADTDCSTAGNGNGTIVKEDISEPNGDISTRPGMCTADVIACRDDILAIDEAALTEAGLNDLKGAYDNIPDELKDSGAATDSVRKALYDTL